MLFRDEHPRSIAIDVELRPTHTTTRAGRSIRRTADRQTFESRRLEARPSLFFGPRARCATIGAEFEPAAQEHAHPTSACRMPQPHAPHAKERGPPSGRRVHSSADFRWTRAEGGRRPKCPLTHRPRPGHAQDCTPASSCRPLRTAFFSPKGVHFAEEMEADPAGASPA